MITGKVVNVEVDEKNTVFAYVEYTFDNSNTLPETRLYKYETFTKEQLLLDIKTKCEELMECVTKKNLLNVVGEIVTVQEKVK